jgi:hypothetical protein
MYNQRQAQSVPDLDSRREAVIRFSPFSYPLLSNGVRSACQTRIVHLSGHNLPLDVVVQASRLEERKNDFYKILHSQRCYVFCNEM